MKNSKLRVSKCVKMAVLGPLCKIPEIDFMENLRGKKLSNSLTHWGWFRFKY